MATPTLDEIEAMARAHADTAGTHDGYVRMDVLRVSDALLALVAHVRENGLAITDVREDAMRTNGSYARAVERIAALEAKVAALEARKGLEPKAVGLVSEMHRERDAEIVRLRAENAELRKRLEAGTWPAPQPIETAPLGRILVVFEAGQMEVIRPVKVDTESSWREFLRMNKATHWWPVPLQVLP